MQPEPATARSRVDIIIRAKDGHELTTACVNSIRDNTPSGTYRLIISDDGSQEPVGITDALLIRSPVSNGAVTATNYGLAISLLSDDPYVIVLDNDTRVPTGDTRWLERFVDEMDRRGPNCAALGATTNFANPPQHILHAPETYTTDWKDEHKGSSGKKDPYPAIWFISFCVMLRKDAVRRAGFWDERYNPGNWEDTDYAIALRSLGYDIHVAQTVYIHHEGHKTFSDKLKTLLEVNREKFAEKWGIGRLWDMGVVSDREVYSVVSGND